MGQSRGLSPRAELDAISGSPGVSSSRVFIGRGDVENVMGQFYENVSFGSHDKPLLVCRGLLNTYKKPTMNSEYEFIVATHAIFIRGGELEKFKRHFYEAN